MSTKIKGEWTTDDWAKKLKQQAKESKKYRHKLYEKVNLKNKKNILDVGCGTGEITLDLAKYTKGNVIGIDNKSKFYNEGITNFSNDYTNITAGEAWNLLTDIGNGIQIPIDVRTNSEWNAEHIDTPIPENPRHYCLDLLQNETMLQKFITLYDGMEVILYCGSGYRSFLATNILIDNNFNGQSLSEIIFEYKQIINGINKMIKNNYDSFSCRINFIKKDNIKILMDAKISLVKDKFNDVIGIFIISREVKELQQFKAIYNITDREAEIIENIIYGKTNKEMSDNLNISENTVKYHLRNIMEKLHFKNRAQMAAYAAKRGMAPDSTNEKE